MKMKKKDNDFDDFSIEEKDDPRTWTDELVQDCEKDEKVPFENDPMPLPILEYLAEFKALIDACGHVSYFFNMKKFVKANVNKAKAVASAYHHDLRYYQDQLNEWRTKARRSYSVLSIHAGKLGYEMPVEIDWLNQLAFSEDRRSAYKGYLNTCLKNFKIISPKEMEEKFQQRLLKRLKRLKTSTNK